MMNKELLEKVSYILVLVGGILWGLLGLFDLNLLGAIFGTLISRLVYIIVGVAAGYLIYIKFIKKTPTM